MSDSSFTPILLALPSLTPSLALEVLPHGVTLHRLFVQADGRTHDLLVGPEDPKGHLTKKYTNTLIGRYTNRVPVGTHTVAHKGVSAQVTPQASESPTVSLHGGPAGYDFAEWEAFPLDVVAGTAAAGGADFQPATASETSAPGALFTPAELATFQSTLPQGASALFRHISPDGDQGYPGTLLLEVVVGLLSPQAPSKETGEYHLGSVVIIYRAKLIGGANVVTPINLTQHWGFNLDASLKDSLSVLGHHLTIKATDTVEVDPVGLPTGKLNPVKDTPHEHAHKLIGDKFPESGISTLGAGYDHFYVFDPARPQRGAAAKRIPLGEFTPELDLAKDILAERAPDGVVELASAQSGLHLVFNSNQSGVQFYSNNLATGDGARKKIHGGSGASGPGEGYGPGSAVFLEFHEPHASFLHPSVNPSGDNTLLGPDEIYNNYVRVDVLYKSPQA